MFNSLILVSNRGPAPFHRLTPNKRFEPVFSTVIMAVCSLFNKMLLLTDLIPVHLLYCGQTVIIGCNHTSFEWTRAVRHIYGIIRHMQGLYSDSPSAIKSIWISHIGSTSSARSVNGSQLAKMKKSIPGMSLPWNLWGWSSWSKKLQIYLKNYDLCEYVEFGSILWKFDILSMTA